MLPFQVPRPSPLWSLAGLVEPPSFTYVVPGLLPPLSPQKGKNLLEQSPGSESRGVSAAIKCDNAKTNQGGNLEETKELVKSTLQHQTITTTTETCAEITPSQVVDMEILLELAQEDEKSNVSLDSQHVIPTSGFCIDRQVKVEVRMNIANKFSRLQCCTASDSVKMIIIDLFLLSILFSQYRSRDDTIGLSL